MNDLHINILGFVVCVVVIVFSGTKLSYYVDKIAILTGMSCLEIAIHKTKVYRTQGKGSLCSSGT